MHDGEPEMIPDDVMQALQTSVTRLTGIMDQTVAELKGGAALIRDRLSPQTFFACSLVCTPLPTTPDMVKKLWAMVKLKRPIAFEGDGSYHLGEQVYNPSLATHKVTGKLLMFIDSEPSETIGERIAAISFANNNVNLLECYLYDGEKHVAVGLFEVLTCERLIPPPPGRLVISCPGG